ncbi:MAG: serine hydrolase [Bacteroidetes bacterium]|nr:MAG: serine hydrolase [Bacteroidota bacterium]
MKSTSLVLLIILSTFGCKDDTEITPPTDENQPTAYYFPPSSGIWETTLPETLGWNADSLSALYSNLENNDTRAFLVLKDGKIVLEKYWGRTLLNDADFDANKMWYWASAAKTLTAFTIGKMEESGSLSLTDKSSIHLGEGWTSLTKEQEDKITVWNQLTMTSGLDDGITNPDDTTSGNLQYKADAGTRWAYHNAPYTILEQVVSNAGSVKFDEYFDLVLSDKINMTGFWQWTGDNHLYLSNARSAARYGLLMLNNGVWGEDQLINKEFIDRAISPSQELNKSYGYLWWLNGSESYRLPQSQFLFPGKLLPKAPNDVYSAMGKNGQYVSISPSNGLVVIRMGENPSDALVPLLYLDDIWGRLMNAME